MLYSNIHIQNDLFAELPELLTKYNLSENILLLSDINTFEAYKLYDLPVIAKRHINLFALPKVSVKAAIDLGNIARDYDVILAVGSGSINDMAKYAAHHAGIPYIIMASAPSMNGYIAANATLWDNGVKKSYQANPPRALLADISVLKNAPKPMIASGIADTLCRSSVQFDTILAKYLSDSTCYHEIFKQIIALEKNLLHKINEAEDYIDALMNCLIFAGDVMTKTKTSAPASGSEHMVVHLLEQLIPDLSAAFLHGELVGVISLITMQLQADLLTKQSSAYSNIKPKPFSATQLEDYFEAEMLNHWQAEYQQKLSSMKNDVDYQAMFSELASIEFLSAHDLSNILQKVGGSTSLTSSGLSEESISLALYNAHLTRNRITILDLI
jgi:glycerol-1-phosphate dehydrogenase [NAD(P)+]